MAGVGTGADNLLRPFYTGELRSVVLDFGPAQGGGGGGTGCGISAGQGAELADGAAQQVSAALLEMAKMFARPPPYLPSPTNFSYPEKVS